MIASVLIEYSIKKLDKTFDYLVPFDLEKIIKVGHKVLVPFGNGNKLIEGFVLKIHNDKPNIDLKSINSIVDVDFYLNKELLNLGLYLKKRNLSTLISNYQMMLPKALKASNKTNINKKYEVYVLLNKDFDIESYITNNKRNKKEIEIINILKDGMKLKKELSSPSLNNLIKKGIVLVENKEVLRGVSYIEEEKKDIILTDSQVNAFNMIMNEKDNKKFLLYGVTGSGKTEVYIKVIDKLLTLGKTAILLVPEISLTPQIVARFKSEFKESVAVLHSRLSEGEKYDEYRRIMSGAVSIVVGARSAVFAPLKNLGAIIIDEAHSETYRQENNPKYSGIEVATKRCDDNNAIMILGSATPTLESFARANKGVYKLITLESRYNGKDMPKIHLIDMNEEYKKRNYLISSKLVNEVQKRIDKNEQSIILLNRRGHATFISCSSCGYVYKCPNCDISLTYHKTSNNFRCHYCGYSTYKHELCPNCHSDALRFFGYGTEKLEEYLMNNLKGAKIIRMDVDTTYKKGSHAKIIDDFRNEKYNVLVGTQMISKGLNFPKVTLVGVVNADASLFMPDFRSSERTFDLLTQTSGRSGRNDLEGNVYIETHNMDNYVLSYIKKYDYLGFYKEEMDIRRKLKYPPYYYITTIKVISEEYEASRNESVKIKQFLDKNLSNDFIILGPTTANVLKLKNKYYFNILIKYKREDNLLNVLNKISEIYSTGKVSVDFDINC